MTTSQNADNEKRTLTFAQWIDYVFDHPYVPIGAEQREWYYDRASSGAPLDWWRPDPPVLAEYLARLFENSAGLAERFSPGQLYQGFGFIASRYKSAYFHTALSDEVPVELQKRWLLAIAALFRHLFARVPILLPGSSAEADDPNDMEHIAFECFGNGDLRRIGTSPFFRHLVDPYLDMLGQILMLDSDVCQAAALNELSILVSDHPRQTRDLLTEYLGRSVTLHPKSRAAAEEILRDTNQPPVDAGLDEPLSFEAWIEFVFDHPCCEVETDEPWYYSEDREGGYIWWNARPRMIAKHMTRLFENASSLLERYSEEQVSQGLRFILQYSWYCEQACDDVVPLDLQIRWVRSFVPLYKDVFAKHCSDDCEHDDQGRELRTSLEWTCFMFWHSGSTQHLYELATWIWNKHLTDPVFEVLEQLLAIPSLPCQSSALHALGHLEYHHPARVHALIDDFLSRTPAIDDALKNYASRARAGRNP